LALNPKIGPPVRGLTTPRILRPIRAGYVIPQEEYDAYQAGNFAPVPAIVGCTANEGAWFVGELPVNTVAEYEAYLRQNFGESTDEALRLYPVRTDADVKPALAAVFGDTQFTFGTRGLARAISSRQPKTFRYLFAHGTAGHADDTSYIFGTETEAVGKSDLMISDAMMRYWVQFATTGDPNVASLPPWPAYDSDADNFLKFGAETIEVDRGWHTETLDFIDRYLHPRVPSM
jgi:para-nitrobenzyl esterase